MGRGANILPSQVMQAYYSTTLPQPGEEFEFSPDDTLQPVHYHRPALQFETSAPEHKHRCQIVNMETEAAEGLRHWAVAVLCRCLSLQNILALLSGKCETLTVSSFARWLLRPASVRPWRMALGGMVWGCVEPDSTQISASERVRQGIEVSAETNVSSI